MDDNLLTFRQAAEYLGVHWQTIRNYVKSQKLSAVKVGRTIRVRKSDLDSLGKPKFQKREIELRFMLPNREKVELALRAFGGKISGHSHLVDHYFGPTSITNLEDQHAWYEGSNGFALRIREVKNDYSDKVFTSLEIKKPVKGSHNNLITSEIDVASCAETKELLELMNFKEFLVIDKQRLMYKLDNLLFCFDEIKGWGTGLEIELITDMEYELAEKVIMQAASKVGLGRGQLIKTSFTRLAMPALVKFH